MQTKKLGERGFGCMGLSYGYGPMLWERNNTHAATLLLVLLLVSPGTVTGQTKATAANSNSQIIYRSNSQSSTEGPAEFFTGDARIDPLFPSNDTARYSGAYVTFQPGARSVWHFHPAGQHILVTSGVGRTGVWEGPVEEIRAGDVIWCPPGVKHWHGASPRSAMTHLVITGVLNGNNVEQREKVTDEQYNQMRETSGASPTETTQALSRAERAIIPIAAFTASGDTAKLKAALNEGLDASLTVNETKEVLVQMYAYAGFPRSLNGIQTFMAVLEERKARGIKDEVGKEASPSPSDLDKDEYGAKVRAKLAGQESIPPPSGYQLFTPVIDTFLKEHLFADIFVRDVLDHRQRELATIAALANMDGTEGQLRFHLRAAMNVGLTNSELDDFISVLAAKVSDAVAASARRTLAELLGG